MASMKETRDRREPPELDDKVLTDWNGLMIAGLARAALIMDEPAWAEAAARAADFLLERMSTDKGVGLMHRYRDGEAAIEAMADDFAFLCWGLLELHAYYLDPARLAQALRVHKGLEKFIDPETGAYFFTSNEADDLPVRKKEFYDGAIPSGNSVILRNTLTLARLTGRAGLEQEAAKLAEAISFSAALSPAAHAWGAAGIALLEGESIELVIVGRKDAPDTTGMIEAARKANIPGLTVLFKNADSPAETDELAPFTSEHAMLDGRATAYVCRAHACMSPTTDINEMLELMS